jgi:hypothetical protein
VTHECADFCVTLNMGNRAVVQGLPVCESSALTCSE